MIHVLFSNLKNVPKHDKRCFVDVNKTGMWNESILKKCIDRAVSMNRTLFDLNAKILFILDSYLTHIKFVNEHKEQYEAKGVHFAIVPKNMTGLLQPLDVCVNRSMQQYFNDRNDSYQEESINQNTNHTAKGNVKMPSSELVTEWVAEWAAGLTDEHIKRAFDVTGLVPPEDFDVEKLYTPLREVFNHSISTTEWFAKYSSLVTNDLIDISGASLTFTYTAPTRANKKQPGDDGATHPFFKAIYASIDTSVDWKLWSSEFIAASLLFLKEEIPDIFTAEGKERITKGDMVTSCYLEGFAAAHLLQCPIYIIGFDKDDRVVDTSTFGLNFQGEVRGFYVRKTPFAVIFDPEFDPSSLPLQAANEVENSCDSDIGEEEDIDNEQMHDEFLDDSESDANNKREMLHDGDSEGEKMLRDEDFVLENYEHDNPAEGLRDEDEKKSQEIVVD